MYVITFYSFKGGVGRTMALVNVAAELVRRGRKVLVVDFDLEAPGLETYKRLRPSKPHPGIVEYVTEFRRTQQVPNLLDFIYEAKSIGKKGGRLWVMPAGRRDRAYRNALAGLDWKRLYQDQGGFLLFEDTKKGWEEELKPDYVLIDSRTGDTDVLGICTRQLPDSVVLMFTPNRQNLAGLVNVCRDIRREETEGLKKKVRLHFVAANVPDLDDEKGILRRQVNAFRNHLAFEELSCVIRRYESLKLLDQDIFVINRPQTRLARSYRKLSRVLLGDNLTDRQGVSLFLRKFARRYLPSIAIDVKSEVKRKLGFEAGRPCSMSWSANSPFLKEELSRLRPGSEKDPLDEIIGNFLDDASVLYEVAKCRVLSENYRRALGLLNRVLQLRPDLSHVRFERALCKSRIGDRPGAARDLLDFLGTPDLDPHDALRALWELHNNAPGRIVEAVDLPAVQTLKAHYAPEICELLVDSEEGLARAIQLYPGDEYLLILAHRWKEAIKVLEERGPEPLPGSGGNGDRTGETVEPLKEQGFVHYAPENLFQLAIAYWGEEGVLSESRCQKVLESLDELGMELHTDSEVSLVMKSLVLWGAGRKENALIIINDVIEKVKNPRRSDNRHFMQRFSPWRYREVSQDRFLDDCQLFRRMFEGESVRPAFLGPIRGTNPI